MMRISVLLPSAAALLVACATIGFTAQAETTRVRGTLAEIGQNKITIDKRDGGVEPIGISKDTKFMQVTPIGIEEIRPGSYIGVAGVPQPDGKIEALGRHGVPGGCQRCQRGAFSLGSATREYDDQCHGRQGRKSRRRA